ncbi:hypothetical protein IFM89_039195 [Coptis chinensis]|uniref:Uncharacterized protein n=1 Tax=Coptis chinensis TaxID=261450 RepID=A0A835LXY3_9MAGN|nr:hypothetical protein IFM89_039195 [Coptis chinensis]
MKSLKATGKHVSFSPLSPRYSLLLASLAHLYGSQVSAEELSSLYGASRANGVTVIDPADVDGLQYAPDQNNASGRACVLEFIVTFYACMDCYSHLMGQALDACSPFVSECCLPVHLRHQDNEDIASSCKAAKFNNIGDGQGFKGTSQGT